MKPFGFGHPKVIVPQGPIGEKGSPLRIFCHRRPPTGKTPPGVATSLNDEDTPQGQAPSRGDSTKESFCGKVHGQTPQGAPAESTAKGHMPLRRLPSKSPSRNLPSLSGKSELQLTDGTKRHRKRHQPAMIRGPTLSSAMARGERRQKGVRRTTGPRQDPRQVTVTPLKGRGLSVRPAAGERPRFQRTFPFKKPAHSPRAAMRLSSDALASPRSSLTWAIS